MKYRIRAKQIWSIFKLGMGSSSDDYKRSRFYVQSKSKWLPFWVTVTTYFDDLPQAEEYIKLILDEKGNDEANNKANADSKE